MLGPKERQGPKDEGMKWAQVLMMSSSFEGNTVLIDVSDPKEVIEIICLEQ